MRKRIRCTSGQQRQIFPTFVTFIALLLFLFTCPLAEGRAPRKVNCERGESLQAQLDKAQDGDVIEVVGICSENVVIENNRVTLQGIGGAVINGPDATVAAILVRGLNVRIMDFGSISGGSDVLTVHRGASAHLQNNVIEHGTSSGVLVNQSAHARVIGNILRNNGTHGVIVRQSASANILNSEIANNSLRGIQVSDAAEADIEDNDIINNGSDGIRIRRTSHIRLSGEPTEPGVANRISGNGTGPAGGRGIRCQTNSSISSGISQDFTGGNSLGNTLFEATCVTEGPI